MKKFLTLVYDALCACVLRTCELVVSPVSRGLDTLLGLKSLHNSKSSVDFRRIAMVDLHGSQYFHLKFELSGNTPKTNQSYSSGLQDITLISVSA